MVGKPIMGYRKPNRNCLLGIQLGLMMYIWDLLKMLRQEDQILRLVCME